MFLVFSAIKLKNKNKKIIYVNITSNSTENNGFKSWCHWKPGPDEQGLEIHNILQCVWKQRNTFFFFPFYWYVTQWKWEKSWDEEYRGECPVGIEIQVKKYQLQ